ncbi:prolyl hydroxylase family protein [Ningiella sp. W23]|uniref:prolyl hydroxylase family protein n=1 Tax=Ningiella sp. W23 TaxID=3023715 RepID=UPI0037569442
MAAIPAQIKHTIKTGLKRGDNPNALMAHLIESGWPFEVSATLFNKKHIRDFKPERDRAYYNSLAKPKIMGNEEVQILEGKRATVLQLDNFLSQDECEVIINAGKGRLEPSVTLNPEAGSGFRTSSTCHFEPGSSDVISGIDHKIIKTLGLAKQVRSESIQIQRYQANQQYKAHYDFFMPGTDGFALNAKNGGQRSWTFMVYLSNVESGGETYFPQLKLSVAPKRGTAVVWNNLDALGTPNKRTLHAGTPVISGEKFIITKWFREML